MRHASSPRRYLALWRVILLDLLAAALILGVFAFGKLALPALRSPAPSAAPSAGTAPPSVTAPLAAALTPAPTPEATPEPTPTPDLRTPWQIRFAEHFSDTPVLTENSYTSPEVSIRIETYSMEELGWTSVYHVADIYIASLDNFRTATVDGELRYWSSADVMELDAASNAILAISGDFYSYQSGGFIMRNGEIYQASPGWADICVLYGDGRMETYSGGQYDVEQILADGAVQVWQFGPLLLDEEGRALERFPHAHGTVNQPNPRSAVGYYEPGHYCFVVVDGRQDDYSHGLLLPGLSKVFEALGCRCAYNLDGGGSAVMTFNHGRFSRQSNGAGRELGDILLITEPGFPPAGEEGLS